MDSLARLALSLFVLFQILPASGEKGPLDFRSAFLESEEFRFESATKINWAQVAHKNFRLFDITHPDPKQIQDRWSEVTSSASFEYQAPLPPDDHRTFYYGVSAQGLMELKPEKLVGQILFPSESSTKATGPPQLTGMMAVKAAADGKLPGADFVLISEVERTSEVSSVTVAGADALPRIEKKIEGNKAVYIYKDGEGYTLELGRQSPKYPGPQHASLIRISGDAAPYLFVHWTPDAECIDTCRASSYALCRVQKDATPVISNDYGCDV